MICFPVISISISKSKNKEEGFCALRCYCTKQVLCNKHFQKRNGHVYYEQKVLLKSTIYMQSKIFNKLRCLGRLSCFNQRQQKVEWWVGRGVGQKRLMLPEAFQIITTKIFNANLVLTWDVQSVSICFSPYPHLNSHLFFGGDPKAYIIYYLMSYALAARMLVKVQTMVHGPAWVGVGS